MRTSDSIKSISAALSSFQKEVTQPAKNQTADTGKYTYDYLDLPALLEHVKPLMEKNGLLFTSCGFEARIIHVPTAEWIEGDFQVNTTGLDAQKVGAAITYSRRYALQSFLGICAEEDDDAASAKPAPRQQAPPPKKTAPKREQPQGTEATGTEGDGSGGPPQDDGSMQRIFAKILRVTSKPGQKGDGTPYTRYGVLVDWPEVGERWLNTFSDTLGKVAKQHANTQQTILYSESQWNGRQQFDIEGFDL